MSLKWQDLDLEWGLATIHQTQNGERRALAITGLAAEVMRAWRRSRGSIAIRHEKDVRLIVHIKYLPVDYGFEGMHVSLDLGPLNFVDGITIDPRADE